MLHTVTLILVFVMGLGYGIQIGDIARRPWRYRLAWRQPQPPRRLTSKRERRSRR